MGKYISYLLSLYNKNTEKRNLLQFKCKRFLKLMTLWKIRVFRATDKQGIVLKTEYDAEAAFLTLYMGEQERRFLVPYKCKR